MRRVRVSWCQSKSTADLKKEMFLNLSARLIYIHPRRRQTKKTRKTKNLACLWIGMFLVLILTMLIKVQYWLEELILGKGFTQKTNSNSQLYSDHDSQYKILMNKDLLIRSNYSPIAITNWAQQLLQICLILHFVTYLSQSFAAPGAFRNLFVSKQRGTEHSLNNFQLKLNEMVHRNLLIDVTK